MLTRLLCGKSYLERMSISAATTDYVLPTMDGPILGWIRMPSEFAIHR